MPALNRIFSMLRFGIDKYPSSVISTYGVISYLFTFIVSLYLFMFKLCVKFYYMAPHEARTARHEDFHDQNLLAT